MKPQERDTKFIPVPADFFATKTGRRLFRAGPIHQLRFLWLVFKAHSLGKYGQLKGSDNEPLDVEDLADDHDGDAEGWKFTIKVCHDLNLVEFLDDGTIKIVSPEYWTRPPSSRPQAIRERKRKQRERQNEEDDDEKTEDMSRPCHDPVTAGNRCHSDLSKTRSDQIRSEEDQIKKRSDRDQNRTEEDQIRQLRELDGWDLSAEDFSESDFLKTCGRVHRVLTNSDPPSNFEHNVARAAKHWLTASHQGAKTERYCWKDLAGAVLLAGQHVLEEQAQGKTLTSPFGYLLTILGERHLVLANSTNYITSKMQRKTPFKWHKSEGARAVS